MCLGVLKDRSSTLQLMAETVGMVARRAVETVVSFMMDGLKCTIRVDFVEVRLVALKSWVDDCGTKAVLELEAYGTDSHLHVLFSACSPSHRIPRLSARPWVQEIKISFEQEAHGGDAFTSSDHRSCGPKKVCYLRNMLDFTTFDKSVLLPAIMRARLSVVDISSNGLDQA